MPNESISPVENTQQPVVNSMATTQSAASAGAAAQANAMNSNTMVKNNMASLQTAAPEVWQMMEQSLGMSMCRQMQRQGERIKKLMRDSNNTA